MPPYEKMRQVAELVAQAVYQAYEKVEYHDWVKLGVQQEDLTLAVRKPTADQVAYAKRIQEKPEDQEPYHKGEKIYAERVLQLLESPEEISVPLQSFRIGDLGICAIPFEVFVEIGLEIKSKSLFEHTFTISHTNGSYGYLPTVEQHKLGGYETWLGTNLVEFEAAPKVTRTLLNSLSALN